MAKSKQPKPVSTKGLTETTVIKMVDKAIRTQLSGPLSITFARDKNGLFKPSRDCETGFALYKKLEEQLGITGDTARAAISASIAARIGQLPRPKKLAIRDSSGVVLFQNRVEPKQ